MNSASKFTPFNETVAVLSVFVSKFILSKLLSSYFIREPFCVKCRLKHGLYFTKVSFNVLTLVHIPKIKLALLWSWDDIKTVGWLGKHHGFLIIAVNRMGMKNACEECHVFVYFGCFLLVSKGFCGPLFQWKRDVLVFRGTIRGFNTLLKSFDG